MAVLAVNVFEPFAANSVSPLAAPAGLRLSFSGMFSCKSLVACATGCAESALRFLYICFSVGLTPRPCMGSLVTAPTDPMHSMSKAQRQLSAERMAPEGSRRPSWRQIFEGLERRHMAPSVAHFRISETPAAAFSIGSPLFLARWPARAIVSRNRITDLLGSTRGTTCRDRSPKSFQALPNQPGSI